MWVSLLVLGIFPLANGGQIFDVTTIYDIGDPYSIGIEGRVLARTNALGLSYYNVRDESADPTTLLLSNLTCDSQERFCNWNIKNWRSTHESIGPKIEEVKAYKMKKLSISFDKLSDSRKVYLYVTIGPGSIKAAKTLLVILFHKSNGVPKIYENLTYRHPTTTMAPYRQAYYYSSDYKINLLDRSGFLEYVDITYTSSTSFTQFDYNNNYVSFQVKNGKLQLHSDFDRQNLIREWSINEGSSDNIYFSLSGVSPGEQSFVVPVLEGSKKLSEISSPLFTPENRELCLAIVIKAEQSTDGDVLEIFAKSTDQSLHFLTAVNNVKDYYEVKHLNILLEDNISMPFMIIVRHLGVVKVHVTRISSCSSEGEEEILLPPLNLLRKRYTDVFTILPIYSPVLNVTSIQHNKNRSCFNGGILTSGSCACLPGFTGEDCEIGCGKNRFGHDCLGLCSLNGQECRNLLLCTKFTGCHCAPGYYGDFCNNMCPSSTYGNNCLEQCGLCKGNTSCDIHSGKCNDGCEPGYHPPYCKEEYVYYSTKPVLSSNKYGTITVSFEPSKYIKGYGEPELYQIQYREKGTKWLTYSTKSLKSNNNSSEEVGKIISEDITSLKDGTLYESRILFTDKNFNKYDGHLVGVSEILTKCSIPGNYDYKITSSSNTTSFSFSWNYKNDTSHWCPLLGYEISWKGLWKWTTRLIPENYLELNNFVPGSTIKFKVRAKTTGGYAPLSKIVRATTVPEGSSSVTSLHIVSTQGTSVTLSWNPPVESRGRKLLYTITYKCVEQPACYPGCHNATEGVIRQEETSVTLRPLLPFTQYLVTVTPEDGIKSIIYVGTSKFAPVEIPKLSTQPPLRTNTSITVFWDEVPVCSSFLQGYNYQLTKKAENFKILSSGFTKDTKVTFQNLTASTEYTVRIFIVTVAGWNAESFLLVDVSTSATVPEAVRNLEIYKRGRNMLGLRWAEPRVLYGQIKSFTVKYSLGNNVTTETIAPTHCIPWPELYCHTIEGLKSSRRYNITVSARNVEVEETGEEALVSGITKETLPTLPENLKELNASSTSVALQWSYPNLTNGVLRSFLISVEETEVFDQDTCCQVYPLVEIPVNEETQHYEAEVSGLHPAATYFVTVSAKTVGMGPSQTLVTHTRPPYLNFTVVPQTELGLTWLPQPQLPEVNNSEIYTSLIRAHFVIAVFNNTELPSNINESGILDSQLETLLKKTIDKPFMFISEYNQDELLELNLDTDENESSWGQPPSSYQCLGYHQLVAVQLTEYSGVYNVDLRYSSTQ